MQIEFEKVDHADNWQKKIRYLYCVIFPAKKHSFRQALLT